MPKVSTPIPPQVADRAYSNVEKLENGCWESRYSKKDNGYAQLTHGGKGFLAHRASYTKAHGPIPQGMVVDHMCFNRACVNPDHLRLLTLRDNTRRKKGQDFPLGQCPNGHPDSFLKLYHWGAVPPQWGCSECLRERNARGMARRKAQRSSTGGAS